MRAGTELPAPVLRLCQRVFGAAPETLR
jgi:hypothetical protein